MQVSRWGNSLAIRLLSADTVKAQAAESALEGGAVISVQVLDEFVSVAIRKLRMPLSDLREVLGLVKALCRVVPLTLDVHERGLGLMARYGWSVNDATIVSAALASSCNTLLTEDLQAGQLIERQLRVVNPFA